MPSITYLIRTFRRDHSEIFPAEVHEQIDLGHAWEFFRGYTTPDSADVYSRMEGGLCPTSG